MKKWLIGMVTTMLVVSSAAAALASDFSFDGRVRFKYVDENDKYADKIDTLININSKLNAELDFKAVLRAATGTNDGHAYFDEVYGTYHKPYGTIIVGNYCYSTTGDTTVLTNVVEDLQTDFSICYQPLLKNGWLAKAYFGQGDEDSKTENTNDAVYAVALGYSVEKWGFDVNVEESRLRTTDKKGTVIEGSEYYGLGYVLNSFYVPTKAVRLYFNYETRKQDTKDYKDAILGVNYALNKDLTLIGEYNFEKNDSDSHNWGARVNYQFDKSTTVSLIRSREQEFGKEMKDKNEFRVQIKF